MRGSLVGQVHIFGIVNPAEFGVDSANALDSVILRNESGKRAIPLQGVTSVARPLVGPVQLRSI